MPFTTAVLGMRGRVTAHFGEDRDGCPHKGLDVGFQNVAETYTAGVWGRVAPPEQSEYATITVIPFHAPSCKIQYLHSSRRDVSVGEIVAPWTILGMTGSVAPSNRPVSGIHLHLQVNDPEGQSVECWDGRSFSNPELWDTGNPAAGLWIAANEGQVGQEHISRESRLQLHGDQIGDRATLRLRDHYTRAENGCWLTQEASVPMLVIGREGNQFIVQTDGEATCTQSSNCRQGTCSVRPTRGALTFHDEKRLRFVGGAIYDRANKSADFNKMKSSDLSYPKYSPRDTLLDIFAAFPEIEAFE